VYAHIPSHPLTEYTQVITAVALVLQAGVSTHTMRRIWHKILPALAGARLLPYSSPCLPSSTTPHRAPGIYGVCICAMAYASVAYASVAYSMSYSNTSVSQQYNICITVIQHTQNTGHDCCPPHPVYVAHIYVANVYVANVYLANVNV